MFGLLDDWSQIGASLVMVSSNMVFGCIMVMTPHIASGADCGDRPKNACSEPCGSHLGPVVPT